MAKMQKEKRTWRYLLLLLLLPFPPALAQLHAKCACIVRLSIPQPTATRSFGSL